MGVSLRPGRLTVPMTPAEANAYMVFSSGRSLLGSAPQVDPEVYRLGLNLPVQANYGGVQAQGAPSTTQAIQFTSPATAANPGTAAPAGNRQQGSSTSAGIDDGETPDDDWMNELVDWEGNQ